MVSSILEGKRKWICRNLAERKDLNGSVPGVEIPRPPPKTHPEAPMEDYGGEVNDKGEA